MSHLPTVQNLDLYLIGHEKTETKPTFLIGNATRYLISSTISNFLFLDGTKRHFNFFSPCLESKYVQSTLAPLHFQCMNFQQNLIGSQFCMTQDNFAVDR